MDAKHSAEMLKHLEKQKEFLTEAFRSFSKDPFNLQVEEEMFMRKFYAPMSAQDLIKKGKKGEDESNEDLNNPSRSQ